jgi:hypothetical protein
MTVTTGWLVPPNPQHGDVWQRNSGISFVWDDNLQLWIPTVPADAFAGLLITGGATNQHLSKAGTQSYNLRWVDASEGILFQHQQPVASDTWTMQHGLRQQYVSVTVIPAILGTWYEAPGTVITPECEFATLNSVVLHFTRPLQGTAFVRR